MFTKRWLPGHRRALIVGAIVVGGLLLVARACAHNSRAAAKGSFRRVQVTPQDLRITKTATGQVTPQNRVEVKAPIAGRVEEVLMHEGDAVTQGQILAWMSSADRAALLDAARAQGPESLARWETAYKPAPLLSPLNGSVIVRAVEPGQTVTTNDPVMVVADRLIVKAQVDETDIGAIAVGQSAAISLDAYPDQTIAAHVDHVAYEAKTVNNVTIYEVDVLPEHVPDVMRSGMTATVTFTVAAKPQALVVPVEAVRQNASGASVLMPGANTWDRPSHRTITTGLTDGKWIEATSGLQAGETVLVPSLQLPRSPQGQGRSPFSPFGGGRGNGSSQRRSQ